MKILVTGTAGFIGFHLVHALCEKGESVFGIDNINDYYPVSLKYARLAENGIAECEIVQGRIVQSSKYPEYRFCRIDICDKAKVDELFAREKFDIVVNLAAQAGVRYSIENPYEPSGTSTVMSLYGRPLYERHSVLPAMQLLQGLRAAR